MMRKITIWRHWLLCHLGIHKWKSDSDYFFGCSTNREITLIWWECQRCYCTRLKHITH